MSFLTMLVTGLRFAAQGVASLAKHALILAGALAVSLALAAYSHPDLLAQGEQWLYDRLYERKVAAASLDIEPAALDRVTAVDPLELTEEQAAAVFWLSRKYKVAPEPLGALVAQAYQLGEKRGLDPKLILSVMAIESRFNPYAQSSVGAQGLMQVMTRVHEEKYQHFGGTLAAFDPVSNMQVGSLILKDCITRFGGVQAGLVCYVGAAKLPNDGGYSSKVLAVHEDLKEATRNSAKVLSRDFKLAQAKRSGEPQLHVGKALAKQAAQAQGSKIQPVDAALGDLAALVEKGKSQAQLLAHSGAEGAAPQATQ